MEAPLVLVVRAVVKPGCETAFREATLDNARHSLREPGVVRFDVVQSATNAAEFLLLEAYRSKGAVEAHRASAHYLRWRDAVEPLMAEPRTRSEWAGVHVPPDLA